MSSILVKSQLKKFFVTFGKSVWLFPAVLFFLLVVASAFRISGTSVGIYHNFLYGENSKDSNLLFGEPRGIRSDEWLFLTQLTAAQASSGFPRFNDNIGSSGRDMSVIIDVPYKEWSAVFKPQNLIFFVVPLEYAFAFKWWLLLFMLITSFYFLLLRLFKGDRLLATVFSLAGACSPFIFWWFQTATVATIFYGVLIILLAFRIIDSQPLLNIKSRRITNILYVGILVYLATCFALIQYPPFQIPVAIVTSAVILGRLLNEYFKKNHSIQPLVRSAVILLFGIIGAAVITSAFILTRLDAIKDVAETVYPGSRIVDSGGLKKYFLFDSFLMPQLQSTESGSKFFNNQSEASNFILLLPFLFLPGLFVTFKEIHKRRIDWVFFVLQIIGLLFIVRMFLPIGNEFFSLLLLNKVPNERLVIGLGLVSLLHTFYLIQKIKPTLFKEYAQQIPLVLYSLACFGLMILVGLRVKMVYPGFISNSLKIVLLAASVAVIIYFILSGRKLLAGIALFGFSLASVFNIHPLYRGLGFVAKNPVSEAIKEQSAVDEVWAVAGDIIYENVAVINDNDSLSGVQFYPDVEFWRKLGGPKNDLIYNRYAHVLFESPEILNEPIRLLQPDLFLVQFNCGTFIQQELDYIVSNRLIELPCAELLRVISFPQKIFYVYKLN